MARLTQQEARSAAAGIALDAISTARWGCIDPADTPAVAAELRKIEAWLRKQALAGDRVADRQVSRELGRQVRPSGKFARSLEARARAAERRKGGGD